jgi:hypothetical protein
MTTKHLPLYTIRQVSILALTTIILTLFMATVASAQETESNNERITLSPSSTELKINAGESKRGSMKVVNDGDVSYGFSVYARPYSVSNEVYEPDFTSPESNTDVYKWIQFDKTAYTIEPGQTIDVQYTLRVPAGATPGGHYGVLFAETDERGFEGTGVARKKRVGNLLYVTVNGDYRTSGELKEFILPFWQTQVPVQSSARVVNTGNVDFRAKAVTTAKDIFGRTKFTYTGDPIVLPGTTRLVEMKWENAPSFGVFNVSQNVEFLDQKHENSGYVLIAPRWFPILSLPKRPAVGLNFWCARPSANQA